MPITIGWGWIQYFDRDLVPDVCPGGVSDFVTAAADVYIMRSQDVDPHTKFRLQDISGAKNTILQDSGYFQNETIGFTGQGSGRLDVGTYAVV